MQAAVALLGSELQTAGGTASAVGTDVIVFLVGSKFADVAAVSAHWWLQCEPDESSANRVSGAQQDEGPTLPRAQRQQVSH